MQMAYAAMMIGAFSLCIVNGWGVRNIKIPLSISWIGASAAA